MTEPISEGEPVVLARAGSPRIWVRVLPGPQPLRDGTGVVDLTEAIGRPPGTSVRWAGTTYHVLRPSLEDRIATVRRRAQIVTPKDAGQLLMMAGIGPGQRVGEAGAGTGMMTLCLAHAVGPYGQVVSCDRRADFLAVARENLARAGLGERVEFRERDIVAAGFDATDLDAVVLDLPDPEAALPAALRALAPGGYVVTYTPTYNQLERTVRAMRDAGLDGVRSVELLERALHVGEGATRPEFEMLGHTGFLSVGRFLGPPT